MRACVRACVRACSDTRVPSSRQIFHIQVRKVLANAGFGREHVVVAVAHVQVGRGLARCRERDEARHFGIVAVEPPVARHHPVQGDLRPDARLVRGYG